MNNFQQLCLLAFSLIPITIPVLAQNTQDQVAPLDPFVLTEIRDAPFSEIFTIEDINGDRAYLIKDRDFLPSNNNFSVITLWGDIPEQNILQVIVRYCLPNLTLGTEEAYLSELIILDGDEVLLTLNHEIARTLANPRRISPSQRIPTFLNNPFDDPFFNPFYLEQSSTPATIPSPVECSFGGNRFDLTEFKDVIAQLPEQTLTLRLVFSNGVVENWRLGRKTVQQLPKLPSISGH
ncbi:MAG: hypothetical protein EA365_11410 [Gloeocapsa sp. DLM2.Bin57]|nr:MAG: hypothetical protein EA365_11410 [Gloeocapsa sp. DLM2.Bin57]